ncbi:MAG: isocitrate/isopropylmalate dehydrogenase family protein [Chloroflexi bacterium]|nr:isocitrate/isopropylmalate dehydrogenase family protein [Chloroflexota bacterium]
MIDQAIIDKAAKHFGRLVKEQAERIERVKQEGDWVDFARVRPVSIGTLGGDGIGPFITAEAQRVLEDLLKSEVRGGKVQFKVIEGLTIENRAAKMKSIPDDVLTEIKTCHVTLKAPTHTPEKGDPWPNLESANVSMRKALDLFANVRPVRVRALGIDWTFYRENTEDVYALGSEGLQATSELAFDFRVISAPGSERLIDAAFAHAKKTGKTRVTVVTKANILKTTDGLFLDIARKVAERYPGISWDGWYVDIITAKLLDPARRSEFQVFALPNMWGDIITDEAAEIQGGVGTAGSANIGKRYAMFEAIHGSAPRMVKEGRAKFADPGSMLKASAMLLAHIGYGDLGVKLDKALEICNQYEKKVKITGRDTGATTKEFGDYVLATVRDSRLDSRWQEYVAKDSAVAKR